MYGSVKYFVMINMECCKEWIELYNIKRSAIPTQCALFHSENPRGTTLHTYLRDKIWPKEYPRSWIK